jgi:hypothetical protein
MQLTVLFTDVYDGHEHTRTETFDAPAPPDLEDLDEWADEHLRPRTGDGRNHHEAGYFAEITTCDEIPDLVGEEFDWGV